MNKLIQFLRSKSVAVFIVILGVGLILFFGLRALHAIRRMPPIPPHPPEPIEAEDGIRPWMNLKYVAKVYGVPPEYLVAYLTLEKTPEKAHRSLEELNADLNLGMSENGDPLILVRLEQAILEFHAYPNFREKHEVYPTMSLHFVATQTNIPEAFLFEKLGLAREGNEYKTIAQLSQEQSQASETLTLEVQRVIDAYEGE